MPARAISTRPVVALGEAPEVALHRHAVRGEWIPERHVGAGPSVAREETGHEPMLGRPGVNPQAVGGIRGGARSRPSARCATATEPLLAERGVQLFLRHLQERPKSPICVSCASIAARLAASAAVTSTTVVISSSDRPKSRSRAGSPPRSTPGSPPSCRRMWSRLTAASYTCATFASSAAGRRHGGPARGRGWP